jgi:hypothetical protein
VRKTYVVFLSGGGSISVTIAIDNPLELSEEDVVFLHSITDRMRLQGCLEFEATRPVESTPDVSNWPEQEGVRDSPESRS